MAYLLDANVFIQAKNLHYGFDFCPGFWDWLQVQHAAGVVFSVEKVGTELAAGADDLSAWAAHQGDTFFVPPDAATAASLAVTSIWASTQAYTPAAVNTFLQVVDLYLVAHAHAHGHVVVTHEVPAASTNMPNDALSNEVRNPAARIPGIADAIGRRAARQCLWLGLLCGAVPCHGQASTVNVERDGEAVVIDVDMPVAVKPAVAWSVMVDYDHMATFLSNLTSSKVVARQGDVLQVAQSGRTQVAFMTFSFTATRAVELVPMREIRSSLVAGDFKSYASTTRLVDLAQGVRVVFHGEYVPKAWLPPLVGIAVIETETRKQFAEFAAEMLRRQAAQRQNGAAAATGDR